MQLLYITHVLAHLFSDETPVYEVLRTKNILETVLTRFYQLQEEWDSEDIGMIY